MTNYNLNDNVNDSFEFEVGGHKFQTKYPTMEELEELQKLVTSPEETDGAMNWMYKFITPVAASGPKIDEVMKKQNVRVIRNFQTIDPPAIFAI